jgi:antitoxin (DNA-binding transcriptional repressor) of toxin-antitoxin stability system
MTDAEVTGDFASVLEKIRMGIEVVVDRENRPVAVISQPKRSGRPVAEILRDARERNCTVTLDPDFGRDLEAAIASHQESWDPPSWDECSIRAL